MAVIEITALASLIIIISHMTFQCNNINVYFHEPNIYSMTCMGKLFHPVTSAFSVRCVTRHVFPVEFINLKANIKINLGELFHLVTSAFSVGCVTRFLVEFINLKANIK